MECVRSCERQFCDCDEDPFSQSNSMTQGTHSKQSLTVSTKMPSSLLSALLEGEPIGEALATPSAASNVRGNPFVYFEQGNSDEFLNQLDIPAAKRVKHDKVVRGVRRPFRPSIFADKEDVEKPEEDAQAKKVKASNKKEEGKQEGKAKDEDKGAEEREAEENAKEEAPTAAENKEANEKAKEEVELEEESMVEEETERESKKLEKTDKATADKKQGPEGEKEDGEEEKHADEEEEDEEKGEKKKEKEEDSAGGKKEKSEKDEKRAKDKQDRIKKYGFDPQDMKLRKQALELATRMKGKSWIRSNRMTVDNPELIAFMGALAGTTPEAEDIEEDPEEDDFGGDPEGFVAGKGVLEKSTGEEESPGKDENGEDLPPGEVSAEEIKDVPDELKDSPEWKRMMEKDSTGKRMTHQEKLQNIMKLHNAYKGDGGAADPEEKKLVKEQMKTVEDEQGYRVLEFSLHRI